MKHSPHDVQFTMQYSLKATHVQSSALTIPDVSVTEKQGVTKKLVLN